MILESRRAAIEFQPETLYSGQTGRKEDWRVDMADSGSKDAGLSDVIERARTEGPQIITHHGAERAVVLSIEDYRALAAHKPNFKAYLLGGPKVDDFRIERQRESGRTLGL
jgi:antitoxin Phd